jgi:hypothetical protein
MCHKEPCQAVWAVDPDKFRTHDEYVKCKNVKIHQYSVVYFCEDHKVDSLLDLSRGEKIIMTYKP